MTFDCNSLLQDRQNCPTLHDQAMSEDDVSAMYLLGLASEHGIGINQDLGEAAKWYSTAAERGHPTAHFRLGLLKYHGRGIPKDRLEAMGHFLFAANLGISDAKRALQAIENEGEFAI